MSLVRPGRGFEPTTLRTAGEHSTTRPKLLIFLGVFGDVRVRSHALYDTK